MSSYKFSNMKDNLQPKRLNPSINRQSQNLGMEYIEDMSDIPMEEGESIEIEKGIVNGRNKSSTFLPTKQIGQFNQQFGNQMSSSPRSIIYKLKASALKRKERSKSLFVRKAQAVGIMNKLRLERKAKKDSLIPPQLMDLTNSDGEHLTQKRELNFIQKNHFVSKNSTLHGTQSFIKKGISPDLVTKEIQSSSSLSRGNGESQKKFDLLKEKSIFYQEKLKRKRKKEKKMEKEINNLKSRIQEFEDNENKLKKGNNVFKEENSRLKIEVENLKEKFGKMEKSKGVNQSKLNDMSKFFEKKTIKLGKRILEYEDLVKKLKKLIEKLQKENKKLIIENKEIEMYKKKYIGVKESNGKIINQLKYIKIHYGSYMEKLGTKLNFEFCE